MYNKMAREWDLVSSNEIIFSTGNFNKHVGKYVENFEGVYGGKEVLH